MKVSECVQGCFCLGLVDLTIKSNRINVNMIQISEASQPLDKLHVFSLNLARQKIRDVPIPLFDSVTRVQVLAFQYLLILHQGITQYRLTLMIKLYNYQCSKTQIQHSCDIHMYTSGASVVVMASTNTQAKYRYQYLILVSLGTGTSQCRSAAGPTTEETHNEFQ